MRTILAALIALTLVSNAASAQVVRIIAGPYVHYYSADPVMWFWDRQDRSRY